MRWNDPPRAIDELQRAVRDWKHVYGQIRPHQALGYLTLNEFYAKWSAENAPAVT